MALEASLQHKKNQQPSGAMTKEARSKGACWSCKLRRKKCDERKPACSACTTNAVPCFGYDPRPAWADGGERQRAKAEELQIIVREMASMRRRTKKKAVHVRADASQALEPSRKSSPILVTREISRSETEKFGGDGEVTVAALVHPFGTNSYDPAIITPSPTSNLSIDYVEHDLQASLLMHYMDVVFPGQFPFYNSFSPDGGRGWLLLIMLRTKPLYHAALSMAAYHLRLQNHDSFITQTSKVSAAATLQTHRGLAVTELRNHLYRFQREERAQSWEGNIEVLSCITFLILLENFLGDTETWEVHLTAAQALLPGYQIDCMKMCSADKTFSPAHKRAHCFFSSVLSWFDVLASATTGIKSLTPRYCLDQEGSLNVEMVTGCNASVALAIIDTTALRDWKTASKNDATFSVPDLTARASSLEDRLMKILEDGTGNQETVATVGSLITDGELINLTDIEPLASVATLATRIYACAALVYLDVIVYGPLPNHPRICESVARLASALEEVGNKSTLGLLAWPLCIGGCMSTDEQKEFFSQMFKNTENVSDFKLGNLKRGRMIMEECWRLRQETTETPDLQRAMESLNMKVLLI